MDNPKSLLVVGAINTDLVATMKRAPEAGETITADGFETFGGGKGANQAVSAARNGANVLMLGACGDDANGRARIDDLKAAGIDTTWVRIDPDHPSGVALIFVEPHGENRIAYVPGATLNVPVEHCRDCFEAISPSVVLATNELPSACLQHLFNAANALGSRVILNATPEPGTAKSLLGAVDILIVNEVEARELLETGPESELDINTMRDLLDLGPSANVVTLGARGAIAITTDTVVTAVPPRVNVVDTTGAGDAFCGAFAASLAREESLEQAVRYGVYAGALATEIPGAQASSPTKEAIEYSMVLNHVELT
jgi:ribokinase